MIGQFSTAAIRLRRIAAPQAMCPEAISKAILGHGSNTVAANYGSGYALEVMREHMEKVWS